MNGSASGISPRLRCASSCCAALIEILPERVVAHGKPVAEEHFEPGPGDISEGPGRLTYNSSGRVLVGERWLTEVEIRRDSRTPLATARVQVLRVSHIECLERARDCRPERRPRGVAFMGIGFDRNGIVRYKEVLDDARNEPDYAKVQATLTAM